MKYDGVTKRVVALIPCKDSASRIGRTVRALVYEHAVDEVVVIDDGSSDQSSRLAYEAGARVVRLTCNAGKTAALQAGIAATPDADIYLLVDADTEDTAGEAVHLLAPIIRDEADLVIGVLPSAGTKGGFGTVKRLASGGIRRACGLQQKAPLSGQRAVTAPMLRQLELAPRFGTEVAMTIEAARAGARIVEHDIAMDHEHRGRSIGGFVHRFVQGIDVVGGLYPRLVNPLVRLAVMLAVVMFVAGVLLGNASVQEPHVESNIPPAPSVEVIVVPSWSWDDVAFDGDKPYAFPGMLTLLDAGRPYVAGSVATGDVKDIVRAISAGRRDDNAAADPDVKVTVAPLGLERYKPTAAVRIVVGVNVAGDAKRLRPIILQGADAAGAFESTATKRRGIVDLTDIAPTVRSIKGLTVDANGPKPLRWSVDPLAAHNAQRTDERVHFYDMYRTWFIVLFAIGVTTALAIAWYRRRMPEARGVLRLARIAAAVPLATWATQLLYASHPPTPFVWAVVFALVLGALVIATGIGARGTTGPLRRVLAGTILVMEIDLLFGGWLQLGGFLGSSPALGARYYGLGNVASILLITATILWSALHVEAGAALGPHVRHRAWSRALSIAFIVTVVIGVPGLGSDVGGLFTAAVVFAGLFWALHDGRLPIQRTLAVVGAGIVVVVLAAIGDAQRAASKRTHLGELAAKVANEGFAPLWSAISRKVDANLFGYGFPWTIAIVAAAVAILVFVLKGRWAATLPHNSIERFAVIAALTAGLLAYGVNDSGIVTLVLIAVFLGPFLMVVHRHNRWGILNVEVSTS